MTEPDASPHDGRPVFRRILPSLAIVLAAAAIAVALLRDLDAAAVITTMTRVRPAAAALIIALQLAASGILGLSWKLLVPTGESTGTVEFIAARLVRDAVGELLPLSQLGGYAAGARVAGLLGMTVGMAVASTFADIATEMIAQIAHLLAGAAILAAAGIGAPIVSAAVIGAALAVPAAAGFVAVQIYGDHFIPERIRRCVPFLCRSGGGEGAARADAFHRIWLGQGHPLASVAFHLIAWFLLGCQALVILRSMGVQIGWVQVLAVEALLQGLRSLAFAVPNAVGVQEVAYAALGLAFGFGAEAGVALSLVKRARDVAVGGPVLLIWLSMEGRMWRYRKISP